VAVSFNSGRNRSPIENHPPVESHGQTLSHNVVSRTPRHEPGWNSQQFAFMVLGTDSVQVVVNPTTKRLRPQRTLFLYNSSIHK
jgi:hypothetical protein